MIFWVVYIQVTLEDRDVETLSLAFAISSVDSVFHIRVSHPEMHLHFSFLWSVADAVFEFRQG